jgi:hypothetical protein
MDFSIGSLGTTSHHDANMILPAAPVIANAHAHFAKTQIAFFMHTVHNKANSIRFARQSLCSPRISALLKAFCCGYLNGCPNLTAKGVTKYLNPSPALAKGHMKCPCQGIHSTQNTVPTATKPPASHVIPPLEPILDIDNDKRKKYDLETEQNANITLIPDNNTPCESNLFCFAAFADKRTGTLYNDLTGLFPYMSLKGDMCFLVAYHYKTNAILALPISGFSDKTIFAAYKQQ